MRVRFSTCIGMPIVCDSVDELQGQLFQILLNPDTGRVEGFFVVAAEPMEGTPFLASDDIIRWGTQVHVADPVAVYPAEERVRLQSLLQDKRTLIGQRIVTEGGKVLGTCKDVQFNTESMMSEWMFPRRWWRWGTPVAMSDIIEVTPRAIVVRDTPLPQRIEEEQKQVDLLPAMSNVIGTPEA